MAELEDFEGALTSEQQRIMLAAAATTCFEGALIEFGAGDVARFAAPARPDLIAGLTGVGVERVRQILEQMVEMGYGDHQPPEGHRDAD